MNSSNPLVSLITPCYNGANHIHRLLDSVLNQDYSNLEHYVVDDGSTDGSADVIKSYISKYTNRGYTLKYIFQVNSGQSVAINKALKLVDGSYLLWPDADDYYSHSYSISRLVEVLTNSGDEVSMARCFMTLQDEITGELRTTLSQKNVDIKRRRIFRDAVFQENNFWFLAGGYIAKMEIMKKEIPNLDIFTNKEAGQNFQLLFPLLYKYECITIPDFLYTIVERNQSHSRKFVDLGDVIRQQKVYKATSIATIERLIGISDINKEQLLDEIAYYYDFKINFQKLLDGTSNINLKSFIANYYSSLGVRQWAIVFRIMLKTIFKR